MAVDHSTHQEHVGVMRGEHLERPHLEGSLPCVTQVDMGPPVSYVVGFSYCLRTSNILAGRTVMSPFWDIITLQHFRVLCLPE